MGFRRRRTGARCAFTWARRVVAVLGEGVESSGVGGGGGALSSAMFATVGQVSGVVGWSWCAAPATELLCGSHGVEVVVRMGSGVKAGVPRLVRIPARLTFFIWSLDAVQVRVCGVL